MNSIMRSSLAFFLLLGSANAFFTPQQSSTAAFYTPATATTESLTKLHASKNKQKVTSRTNWANARGYYSTSSIVNANAVDSEAVTTTTATKSPPKIIIAGAPASGKGTQCAIIQSKYGVIHLSTGDMLRAAVAAKTEVGVLAQEYMDAGKLVPDEVIIGVVKDRLAMPDCIINGWLLDGFPRTPAQATALSESGVSADCFIFLNVPDSILVERVVGRRTDPVTGKIYHMAFSPPTDEEVLARLEQRSDDTEEKVKVRLEQFHANVEAVKGSYVDIAVEVDGAQRPEDVSEVIMKSIDAVLA
ncbi:hypothetical protein ACHAXH_002834 [Discostella pseudostelligera]